MKVLFFTHTINLRGVTNSIVDYANYNQSILGNESAIAYDPSYKILDESLDVDTNINLVKYLKTKFQVYECNTDEELEKVSSKYDLLYSQKAGLKLPPIIQSTKTANHAVFQTYEPHGDRYAYISEWLADRMNKRHHSNIPYVPLIVELPKQEDDLRAELGISKDKFIFGRYGGRYTFDLPFAKKAINEILSKYPDIIFLFANTYPVWNHPNVIYTDPFFGSKAKTSFINACDAMIHGRVMGESFGLSICEFLYHNKPVLAWERGTDRHHVQLLKDYNLLYNEDTIIKKIVELTTRPKQNYKQIVEPFSAMNTMKKFKEVFID